MPAGADVDGPHDRRRREQHRRRGANQGERSSTVSNRQSKFSEITTAAITTAAAMTMAAARRWRPDTWTYFHAALKA